MSGADQSTEGTEAKVEAPIDPASRIGVESFRTTFFWPLTLDHASVDDIPANLLDIQAELLQEGKSPWEPLTDGMQHLPIPPRGQDDIDPTKATPHNAALANAYGEYVYFHDFLQRSLFGRTDAKATGPMRIFQRRDIASVDVKFDEKDDLRRFRVERVNLYLFDYGAAVVVVQVHSADQCDLTLDHVLRFNDGARRSHYPYFQAWDGTLGPRQLPEVMQWKKTDRTASKATVKEEGKPAYVALFEEAAEDRRILPLPHWRWLLKDGKTEYLPMSKPRCGLQWRHFSDDRFPVQTTIILRERKDYFGLTPGLWARIAFVDPPGTDPTPYAAAFIAKTFDQHCYDRYHHPEEARADAPVRYLMCDYAMTAVTYRQDLRKAPDKRLNAYAAEIEMHMQRHYFQMFLLQVVERAVMLGFSSRITEAVRKFAGEGKRNDEDELSDRLQEIEKDFLHFVHLFRFTGVSGQLQASELFAQLRALMKSDDLFDDIRTELETAVSFLTMREESRSSEAAERLNVIASLGVVVGIVIALLSMNLFTNDPMLEYLKIKDVFWGQLLLFAATLGFGSGIALAAHWSLSVQRGAKGKKLRRSDLSVRTGLLVFLGLSVLLGYAAALYGILHG